MVEQILGRALGERMVTLRPPIIYGSGDRGLLPVFQGLRYGVAVTPGMFRRFPVSAVHGRDVGRAIVCCCRPEAHGVYHVNDGGCYAMADFYRAMARAMGKKACILRLPLCFLGLTALLSTLGGSLLAALGRKGRAPNWNLDKYREARQSGWTCDASRLREELGYAPRPHARPGHARSRGRLQARGPAVKITIQELSKSFGGRDIFNNFSLEVDSGVRSVVCGPNGTGKSTLLRLLAGVEPADGGRVILPRGCRLGFVEQELSEEALDTPLLTYVLDVLHDWNEFWAEWEEAAQQKDEARLTQLMHRQAELEATHGYNPEHRAKAVLSGLGFAESKWLRTLRELSGGWRERAKLGRVLTAGADVLLLDEPTNHLDMEAVEWLESFLMDFKGRSGLRGPRPRVHGPRGHARALSGPVPPGLPQGHLHPVPLPSGRIQRPARTRGQGPAGRTGPQDGLCGTLPRQGHQGPSGRFAPEDGQKLEKSWKITVPSPSARN